MVLDKTRFLLLTLAGLTLLAATSLTEVFGLATFHTRNLTRCPSCKLRKVRRSYMTGPIDWGLSVLGLFPFRCTAVESDSAAWAQKSRRKEPLRRNNAACY